MEMSQEYAFGLSLLKKVEEELKEIINSENFKSATPFIEAVKYPVTAAMAQIKEGRGPNRDDLLKKLSVVVREFREAENFEQLKKALKELLEITAEQKVQTS